MCAPAPYVIDASAELIDRIAQDDMVRGVTIAAGGFFGPQGRELRVPLADPHQNEKVEKFEYNSYRITNFEMESSALAGLSRLMGHQGHDSMHGHCQPPDKRSEHGIQEYDRYSYQNSTRPYLSSPSLSASPGSKV